MLKLTRPLIVLDIESATPGPRPDPAVDKIVHLAMTVVPADAPAYNLSWQFNPGFLMSPENIECHGITNEMAAAYQTLDTQWGGEIMSALRGSDLAGFNLLNYDIPLLWEELYRVGIDWDTSGVNVIDAGNIFKLKEERTLSAAVQFYCGREHTSAHNAQGDVQATLAVLTAQIERYPDLDKMGVIELAKFSQYEQRVDLAGKIILGPDGDPIYNFGKPRGVKVKDDPGFGYWILNKNFSENTKRAVRRILAIESPQAPDNEELW